MRRGLDRMITGRDPAKSERVLKAVRQMKKLDLATRERAYAGAA
jgi:hypothetical protein